MAAVVRRPDMFGSLHADVDAGTFIKEEAVFNSDGETIPFDTDIDDLADFISKAETDLPLDITNFQPSTSLESPHNLCDVIHQLHGDQQKDPQKSGTNRHNHPLSRIHNETNNLQYSSQNSTGGYQQNIQGEDFRRFPQIYNRKGQLGIPGQDQIISNCLPESPPDSGSEPYSPPQDPKNRFTQGFIQANNQLQKDYNSSPPYERSPPHQFENRISIDSRMRNSTASDYNPGTVDSQYNAVNGNQITAYDMETLYNGVELGMNTASSLSPGSSSSDGSVHSSQSMGYMGVPVSKKRKHSDSPNNVIPEQLNAALLNQQYRHMIQQPIKQEPGLLTSPSGNDRRTGAYFNEAYEINEGNAPVRRPVQNHPLSSMTGSSRLPDTRSQELHERALPLSNNLPSSHYSDNGGAYQVIKWAPFVRESWASIYDSTGKELQPVTYRVDADKGFNFAVADDTFVCQKKNHFQVTVHIGVIGHPYYVKTEEGLKPLDGFYINLYGVKFESQNQTIAVEQSQSDRSKKSFHPVKVDLPGDQVTKVTIGRLHFSETTTNNMRKKGRPNPDQRYFLCVVALHAQAGGKRYTVSASATEKIIVRASNPGQFDQDDIQWQRAQVSDAIYHHGRVGINYDHPDESLVVHGNLKLTGHLMQPSDRRAKEGIQEVDTSAQLENLRNIRICRYRYSPEYAMYAGIDTNREETGVIAQEFAQVMPEAVKDTGDVKLPNGETIPSFLVVDKDRLYMETVGAVKELCKLTGNFEERIDELQRWNKKLTKLRKYDSFRSSTSVVSGITSSNSTPSVSRQGSTRTQPNKTRSSSNRDNQQRSKPTSPLTAPGCMSNRFVQVMIIALVIIMAFSVVAMAAIYIISMSHNTKQESLTDGVISMATLYILELKSHDETNGKRTGVGVVAGHLPNNTTVGVTITTAVKTNSTTSTILQPTSVNTPTNTNNPSLVPIEYCPDEKPACRSSQQFCCTGKQATPFSVKCIHSWRVPSVDVPPFSDHETTQRTITNKQSVTAQVITHGTAKKKKDLKNHRKMLLPATKNPSRVKNDMGVVTGQLKGHPKIHDRQKPSAVDYTNYPTNEDQGFDHEEMIPETKKQVHPIRRRSAKEQENIVIMESLLLIQPNITLFSSMEEEETSYTLCRILYKNYTFHVPVSPQTTTDVLIDLQFNFQSPASVILCSKTKELSCTDDYKSSLDGRIPETLNGSTVDYKLDFTNYISVKYRFRVTNANDIGFQDICDAPDEDSGTLYTEYNVYFHRQPCSPNPVDGFNDYESQ